MADSRTPALTDRWQQLPDETRKAYAAFRAYLEMGPSSRSIRKVAALLEQEPGPLGEWSAKFDWVERSSAWDKHMVDVVQAAMETEVTEMAKRHAQVAVAFQNKIVERLQKLDANELTPTQLIHWLDVSTRLERTARGLPDVSVAHLVTAESEQEAMDSERVVQLSAWLRSQPEVIDVEEIEDADAS